MPKERLIRQRHPAYLPCRDYIAAMIPLYGMAIYMYGARVAIFAALSVVTAVGCDLCSALFMRKKYDPTDLSSVMFALIYTVMLPASIRYGVVVSGVVITVLLGKQAFGGYGHYPFHPAAFGFAFMSLCCPAELYSYPRPFTPIGLGLDSGATLYPGIANALKLGGVPNVDTIDLLLGKYAGPFGTTFCLIILACLVLLIARGMISWQVPLGYLATCAVWSFAFVRIPTDRWQSILYEMLSGALIFSAVFIISIPSLEPRSRRAKFVYGIVMGLAAMFYRTVGVYEMGVCFSSLLVNPLAPYFDRLFAKGQARVRKGGNRTI